jgi:hypothetical protein
MKNVNNQALKSNNPNPKIKIIVIDETNRQITLQQLQTSFKTNLVWKIDPKSIQPKWIQLDDLASMFEPVREFFATDMKLASNKNIGCYALSDDANSFDWLNHTGGGQLSFLFSMDLKNADQHMYLLFVFSKMYNRAYQAVIANALKWSGHCKNLMDDALKHNIQTGPARALQKAFDDAEIAADSAADIYGSSLIKLLDQKW